MNVLIIGLGSIARKHIVALRNIFGSSIKIYALRSSLKHVDEVEGIINLYNIDDLKVELDFIIISNPTVEHLQTVLSVLRYKKPLFIEKPLSHSLDGVEDLRKQIEDQSLKTYIASNLRFHSCNEFIKEGLESNRWGKVEEVNVYCGSYLPDWRPDLVNFKDCYSANTRMGGGVHLDLIHEIDYIYWFFGKPQKSSRYFKSSSALDIDAVDYAHFVLEYPEFVAQITLNYYRKTPKRTYEIITSNGVVEVDLLQGKVKLDDILIFKAEENEIINTYTKQMQYFNDKVIVSDGKNMNDIKEAAAALSICIES